MQFSHQSDADASLLAPRFGGIKGLAKSMHRAVVLLENTFPLYIRDWLLFEMLADHLKLPRAVKGLMYPESIFSTDEKGWCVKLRGVGGEQDESGVLNPRLYPLLDRYANKARPMLLDGAKSPFFFVTCRGQPRPAIVNPQTLNDLMHNQKQTYAQRINYQPTETPRIRPINAVTIMARVPPRVTRNAARPSGAPPR